MCKTTGRSLDQSFMLEPGVYKFLQFKERFREAPFSRDGLVWTVSPTVEVAWTGPYTFTSALS